MAKQIRDILQPEEGDPKAVELQRNDPPIRIAAPQQNGERRAIGETMKSETPVPPRPRTLRNRRAAASFHREHRPPTSSGTVRPALSGVDYLQLWLDKR